MKSSHAMAAATWTAIFALSACAPSHVQPSSPAPSGTGPTTPSAPLEAGQERSGILSAADSVGEDRRMQTWALRGHRGQPIVVDLIATEFDPLLGVIGPGIRPLNDDDSGGSCNARITFTPPEDGIYWLLVQGASDASGGAFRLRASSTPEPQAPGECGDATASRFTNAELSDVPVRGVLAVGDDVHGELTSQDRLLKDGRARAYELHATRGVTLTIDLMSSDFDAYLAITGPGLTRAAEDDDSGAGCDARIQLAVSVDGVYRVIVTSANDGETGRFTLRASREPPPLADRSCDASADQHHGSSDVSPDELMGLPVQGALTVGADVAGELTDATRTIVDGTHALVWTIQGVKDQTVVVDMVSDAFDAYLMVVGPGMTDILTDDDSGGGCNPRLAITFPADGTYRVVANAVDRGAVGTFHLRVSRTAGPVAKGECSNGHQH